MKKLALSFAIYLLWFAAVFDPIGNLYQLRYIALGYAIFCVLVSFSLNDFKHQNHYLRNGLLILVTLFMPIYGGFLYFLYGGVEKFVDTSYIASGVLILTTLLYKNQKLCETGIRAMNVSLRLLVLVIISIYAFMLFDFDYGWVAFFTESNIALISSRAYGGLNFPYIYFLASPMLIYLIGWDIYKLTNERTLFRLVICLVTIFAFALTGTRAHMILALMYIPIYYLLVHSNNRLIDVGLIGGGSGLVLLIIGPDLISDFFSAKEASNELKIQLLDMYLDIFSNPITLIFGQGFNAHEWSAPLREKLFGIENASKTELTYWELIRVYGFMVATIFYLFMGFLIYKISRLKNEFRWIYPAFVIFMINAALNPYLFSSNGMLPMGLLLAIISLKENTNESQKS